MGPINPTPGYHGGDVIGGRKSIAGSGIGSVEEIKEMLDFSTEHNILPDVEEIAMEQVNEAWEAMQSRKISHRYVINVKESFRS